MLFERRSVPFATKTDFLAPLSVIFSLMLVMYFPESLSPILIQFTPFSSSVVKKALIGLGDAPRLILTRFPKMIHRQLLGIWYSYSFSGTIICASFSSGVSSFASFFAITPPPSVPSAHSSRSAEDPWPQPAFRWLPHSSQSGPADPHSRRCYHHESSPDPDCSLSLRSVPW